MHHLEEEEPIGLKFTEALQEFRRARLAADLEQLRARLTGKSNDLLSYEEVRRMLHVGMPMGMRELRDIPLDAIVGSVGRYKDFTRGFLPRQDGTASRWADLQIRVSGMMGFPPIEVYQIGDAYFVHDGNHRISVARQSGMSHIEAYVTQIETRVPLSPDDDLDDLIIKSEYVDFLEATAIDQTRPNADLTVTTPGRYPLMLAQIEAHRQRLSAERDYVISLAEAAAEWYDTRYLPIATVIRDREILKNFPNRTEADLYAWIHKYRAELVESLGWEVDPTTVLINLPETFDQRPERRASGWGGRLLSVLTPPALDAGPAPGEWRRSRSFTLSEAQIFRNVLVPIGLQENDWAALDGALEIARHEGSFLHGLHIVADPEEIESERGQYYRARFKEGCRQSGVAGELTVIAGSTAMADVMATISDHARWVDLVAVRVDRPPADQALARLSSSIGSLLRRCPRPVLTIPEAARSLQRAVLAYDGSPKADEALYVAAHLGAYWGMQITVVTGLESGRMEEETVAKARQYLAERKIQGEFISQHGEVVPLLQEIAAQQKSDLMIMGGYGFTPLLEVVLGSAVDEILRITEIPVLVCR